MYKTDKITRMLIFYDKLIRGEVVNKVEFSIEHGINERSFDRDVEDIRLFLCDSFSGAELFFDKEKNGYHLLGCIKTEISSVEILALAKLMLDSRAFRDDEMIGLVKIIISLVPKGEQGILKQLINNEIRNYTSPTHQKALLKMIWDLGQGIIKQRKIKLNYSKATGEDVERIVCPISIVFSEFYYYLVAYIDDKAYDYPAFFRVDRINSFLITNESVAGHYYSKYDTGDMKKRIQFMYAGELVKVKLKCSDFILETVLDRLPTSTVVTKGIDYCVIEAEVFGEGFIKWLLSQGSKIELISPECMRDKIKKELSDMNMIYNK